MQVVILAAGQSKRFYPFTGLTHKSLVKVLGKTLLEQTISSIRKTGIKDVVIVVGKNSPIQDHIKDGKDLGLSITYVVQEEPLGMGDALQKVKQHIKDSFFLLHAHHADFDQFKKVLEQKKKKDDDVVLLAQEQANIQEYGVLKLEGERVIAIVEKPRKEEAPSHLTVVGIYLLHKNFFKTLDEIELTHYNLEEAISLFAQQNTVRVVITNEQVISLKYPWELLAVGRYLLERAPARISKNTSIAKNAIIEGHVVVEEGVTILEGACIKGPCYIGKNSFIGNNAIVRKDVILGENVVIGANLEVRNSILMDGTTTHYGFIGDSVIGRNCKIAGNITTGNVRLDRDSVFVIVGGKKIDSHMRGLGVIMGDNVQTGISVSTMPGIVVGNESVIGPSTTVMDSIDEKVTFYTEFNQVTKKRD